MKYRLCSFLLCTYDAISAVMDQPRRMLEVFELLGVQSKLSSAFYVEKMSQLSLVLCVPTHLSIISFLKLLKRNICLYLLQNNHFR